MKNRRYVLVGMVVLLVGIVVLRSPFSDAQPKEPGGQPKAEKVSLALEYPRVAAYGGVVPVANGVERPRNGSKLVVDLTTGKVEGEVNTGLEKVARYLNLYALGGVEDVSIVVVIHGDATPIVLTDRAFAEATGAERNTNRELIRLLASEGVELTVCGQSLAHRGHAAAEVIPEISVAHSALTALVNRQMDGYALIPLH